MATATMARAGSVSDIIKFSDEPETFGLKYLSGKNVGGGYGGQRVMFSTTDGRKIFLDVEDADDLEMQVKKLAVREGDLITVTRVDFPRGGGHALRIERAPQSRIGAGVATSAIATPAAQATTRTTDIDHRTSPAPQPTGSPLMACFAQAIDAIQEAQLYANRKGLGITFTSEDVRATAISCFIGCQKGGAR